ncbi:hypothetical protein DWB61_15505 [Ancylomarina euxinus]|uniref:Uncharacterized protein n=1 Tax=Ancylomarina euxinus TaxID=2283627 RepID=A0A425XXC2_9BACT|nr:hypothetical protein [Ancylomarina euxinus]MCZ4696128.1 hypothetical protein [Ancylomarina euxinus]MUP16537.1 hypothetical protein [Ancylomarina euxinus]RRG19316.1 hypothetical protein DWB61_15505 [Ancylomarina euxinus]
MKDNIYIKALEIGFRNETTGISFDDVVKELGLVEKLKDESFRVNFAIWFYTNFYHKDLESLALSSKTGGPIGNHYRISKSRIKDVDDCSADKSYIKGESIQKYIDYLEIKESRESSQTAKKISYISIGIAILSIFLSPFISRIIPEKPKQVIVTENRDKTDDAEILERLTKIDSTINSTIIKLSLIADKNVEVPIKKRAKVNSVKH